ncbi:SulP family inorganic anion transporter [Cellulomonas endometrii]|uniref:SulP family inorganic anion transporter n=1 Tax=Cellulomonas endometrii TaxID=3036301 RepID=UPI0024AE8402|nr:SulP family inorganic anion transporter [Cellulomonas endometrii]
MVRPRVFPSLAGYRRAWLSRDLLAGLTVWAVLVPESLAYATIAGVDPVVGLYAAVPSLVLYAAAGSSRHLVVGPMSATAALSAGVVAAFRPGDAAAYLALTSGTALVTGLLCLLAALLRAGFLAAFISAPVLKGFIVGLALTIVVGQVPALLGIEKGEGSFLEKSVAVVRGLPDLDVVTTVLGAACLAVVLVLRRYAPRVPGALVVVALGVLAVLTLGLQDAGVQVVGPIEPGLPPLGLPDLDLATYGELVGPAAGVVLVGFAEALGAARAYADRAGYDIDPDRELLGMGLANVGSGLASGMVVNGSLSKTAVNGGAGARSQLSGMTAAALTLATLLLLTPLFEPLPEAALAAVVIAAVVELVDVAALRRLWALAGATGRGLYGNAARYDAYAALAALLGVLVLDTLPGLVIGVVLSLFLLLARASRPHVAVLVRDQHGTWVDVARRAALGRAPGAPVPGVLVVRVDAGLFFANADTVRSAVRALAREQRPRLVVLDARTVPFVDSAAAEMLGLLGRDLRRAGARLVVAEDVGQVRDMLRAVAADGDGPPPERYRTVDEAVAAERPDD